MGCCGSSSWRSGDDWSSLGQFGATGGPVNYVDSLGPSWGGYELVVVSETTVEGPSCGPDKGDCGCSGCAIDRAEAAHSHEPRSTGRLNAEQLAAAPPPLTMTLARWDGYDDEERGQYRARYGLGSSWNPGSDGDWSTTGDRPRGDTGTGSGSGSGSGSGGSATFDPEAEVDPTVMTRGRWATMTEPQRQAWINTMARTRQERDALYAGAVRQGFDGVVAILRRRTDVEIAEINANRDIQIARIRGSSSAEQALLNAQAGFANTTPATTTTSTSSNTNALLGAGLIMMLMRFVK